MQLFKNDLGPNGCLVEGTLSPDIFWTSAMTPTLSNVQHEKLIERVGVLLAMTTKNGCTEAEAMTATALAAKLMEQHDLEAKDVAALKDERIAQQSKPFASAKRPREMHAAASMSRSPSRISSIANVGATTLG